MQLNLDIWHEIIGYLEYPEDGDTLRSLALMSKRTSDLALDAIWRDGENFLAIVSVINSFAPSRHKRFLRYYGFTPHSASPDPDAPNDYGSDSGETEGSDEERADEKHRTWSLPDVCTVGSTWVRLCLLPSSI